MLTNVPFSAFSGVFDRSKIVLENFYLKVFEKLVGLPNIHHKSHKINL